MATDSDPSKWDYPPHTRAKHAILARYLDGWYPKLSSWSGRIVFFDGFAGRGVYTSGEEGSPLVALRRLLNHSAFPRMRDREFLFIFVEANSHNADSLRAAVASLQSEFSPWPTNVKIEVLNETFDDTAAAIIGDLREQKQRLAPTFAFIDPFGYAGLSMQTMAELLAYPQAELFVNFMVGHVSRFIERDGQERAMRGLFGADVRSILDHLDGSRARVEQLRDAYVEQIREHMQFPYVQSFAMINRTGNVGYYLIHATRHPAGVELMKDAMWALDPEGDFTFSDRLAGKDVLFVPEPDLTALEDELVREFAGRSGLTADALCQHVILRTPYRRPHTRKALARLEADARVIVSRPSKVRKGTYPETVTIEFPLLEGISSQI